MESMIEVEQLAAPADANELRCRRPVAINCNYIAPWYEFGEHVCFGGALQRRRCAFLPQLGGVRTALSCGEGDGRFIAALLRSNANVRVNAFDASDRMAEVANRRLGKLGRRADYRSAELECFEAERAPYDLIATHFFLDCFSTAEVGDVVARIARWAAPEAKWIVSEFAEAPGEFGHLWTGAVIRSLYAAFRVTTGLRVTRLPEYRPALKRAGFELQRQEKACGGLLVSEMWQRGGGFGG